MPYLALVCQGLLIPVFAISAIGKIASPRATRELGSLLVQSGLVVSSGMGRVVVVTLTCLEALVAGMLVVPVTRRLGFCVAAALLFVLTVGVVRVVRSETSAACRCFGRASATLSGRHIVRNCVLTAVAIAGAATVPDAAPLPAVLTALLVGATLSLPILLMDDVADLLAPARRK